MRFKDSKLLILIDYLFQLEKEVELNRYILRQYPNIRSNDLKLWKFIMRYRANKTEDSYLKFEIIDKIIFRNKSYERNRSMHNLYKKVKAFMVIDEVESDELIYEWYYWKALQKRDTEIYDWLREELIPEFRLDKMKKASSMHRFAAFQFHYLTYKEASSKTLLKETDLLLVARTHLKSFYEETIKAIDNEMEEMKMINERIFTEQNLKMEAEKAAIFDIETRIKKIDKNISREWFEAFLREIMHRKSITEERKGEYLQLLFNMAYRIWMEGNFIILDIWDVFVEYGFKQKMFYSKGHLTLQNYLNFLSIALVIDDGKLEKYQFIVETYTTDLSEVDYPKGILFYKVFRAFGEKKFKKVIDLIRNSGLLFRNEFYQKIRIHTFLIRSQYEIRTVSFFLTKKKKKLLKENTVAVRKALNKYRNYLIRTKKYKNVIERNLLFIECTRDLLNATKFNDLDILRAKIEEKGVIYKDWLMEKIEDKVKLFEQL